jgi:elongation factor G
VWSLPSSSEERISQLFTPRGKEQLSTPHVVAGDIGGVAKLAATATNDTLCEKGNQLVLSRPVYPEPLFSVAVSPKTKADSAKMGVASNASREDPRPFDPLRDRHE